jgi:hypothetical protein
MKKKLYFLLATSILMLLASPLQLIAVTAEEATTLTTTTTFEEAGTYPVEMWFEDEKGNSVKKTMYVTVTFKNTIVSETYSEGIDAYDVYIPENTFTTLSDDELIALTNARAWDTRDGSHIPIVKVLKSTNGKIHRTSFLTERETMVTVNIIERERQMEEFYVRESYTSPESYINGSLWSFGLSLLAMIVTPSILLFFVYFWIRHKVGFATRVLYDK